MPVQTTPLEVRLTDPHAFAVASAGGGVPVIEVDTLTRALKLSGRLMLGNVEVGPQLTFFNGSIIETIDIDVESDGTTITLALQQEGGGDLTLVFSAGMYAFDCTPAATVVLTAGTDTVPRLNYIYIPASTKVLTANTTGFPTTEHVEVATAIVQLAATVQADGSLKVHEWTNHAQDPSDVGHLHDINHWIRAQHATWLSDIAQTLTITPQGGAPDNVDFATTAGVVLQLHEHAVPVFDTTAGTEIYVVNDFTTPYTKITDLNALLTDSANAAMNGRYFNLVLWASVSEKNVDSKLFVNLPSGSYNKLSDAVDDVLGYTNFSIPEAYKGAAFLISRLTLRHQAAAGGTWTSVQETDLRGQVPNIIAGGGTQAITTEFADSTFRLFDEIDPTKLLAFQLAGIAAATTRTLTVQNADGTIALVADLHAQAHAAADHNASVLPAGFNENLGAYYLDIDDIAVPANPGATIRRIFVNAATGELSVRTSAGATVSLEQGAALVGAHNILDGVVHLDSALDGCSQGSLIVGIGTTPALWDELVIGGAGTYLRSDAANATWSAIQDADVPGVHSGTAHHVAVTLAPDADTILTLVGQLIGLDPQAANEVFAGPVAGIPADPTFRALVDADIPGVHAGSAHHAQAHGPAQHTTGNAWNLLYLDALGDEQEVALGAIGTYLRCAGPAIAPTVGAIQDLDIPGVHTGTAHHASFLQADADLLYDVLGGLAAHAGLGNPHHNELHAAAEHIAAALPAGFNEDFGAFYYDIAQIAVPANPGAGVRRVFMDNATGELSVRTSAGATVSLEAGGGGVAAHNILDGGVAHLDSALDGVTQGSIIVGNTTPAWDELIANASATRKFLRSVSGGVPAWDTLIDGDIPGVHSGTAHHAIYTDAMAILAVEGEATLDLLGSVTIAATKYLWLKTDTQRLYFGGGSDVSLARGALNRLDLGAGDSFRIDAGQLQFSGDVTLSRGAANRLDLATGDDFRIVNGELQTNTISETTGGLGVTMEGVKALDSFLEFSEIATPANPAANKLRVYAKDDGAGTSILATKESGGDEIKVGRGIHLVGKTAAAVTVFNTVVETTLYSVVIPGGLMGTDSALHLVLLGNYYNSTGINSDTIWRVKWGADTIFYGHIQAIPTNVRNRDVELEVWIYNLGATNDQRANANFMLSEAGNPGTLPGVHGSFGAAPFADGAEQTNPPTATDTAANVTLEVTVEHGNADVNQSTARLLAYVELLD